MTKIYDDDDDDDDDDSQDNSLSNNTKQTAVIKHSKITHIYST